MGVKLNIKELFSYARKGNHVEALPKLMTFINSENSTPEQTWQATAAAIGTLFWQESFSLAATLAEKVLFNQSRINTSLFSQDTPFDAAFLAAEVFAQEPAAERLDFLAKEIPHGTVMQKRFVWLRNALNLKKAADLLPGHHPWEQEPEALTAYAEELFHSDLKHLDPLKQHQLWDAARNANRSDIAFALFDDAGHKPARWFTAMWFAGCLISTGRMTEAKTLVINARTSWWPYAQWDCLPSDPVLQPLLRTITDTDVRAEYLNNPIGPEAVND